MNAIKKGRTLAPFRSPERRPQFAPEPSLRRADIVEAVGVHAGRLAGALIGARPASPDHHLQNNTPTQIIMYYKNSIKMEKNQLKFDKQLRNSIKKCKNSIRK